jgi:NAD(P)-dependent dehydrogenase (short-subunit alcohol dehydrogenase family)
MNAQNLPRTCVIAGVGPGLGASLARRFAREGCRIGLLARSAQYLKTLAGELNDAHDAEVSFGVECDLSKPDQIASAFAKVREKLGPVDVLINHASGGGGPRGASFLDLAPSVFEQAWRVGTFAALLCSREAGQDMLANGGGTIIFSGATSSVRGSAVAFSSAKFATRGLAQSLARELWPQGVHVAHVLIDGIIGDPTDAPYENSGKEPEMHPDAIAETYWQLVRQERSSWTLELDLRPNREKFFE